MFKHGEYHRLAEDILEKTFLLHPVRGHSTRRCTLAVSVDNLGISSYLE